MRADVALSAVAEWYANEKPSGPYQPPVETELEPDISFSEDTGTCALSDLQTKQSRQALLDLDKHSWLNELTAERRVADVTSSQAKMI